MNSLALFVGPMRNEQCQIRYTIYFFIALTRQSLPKFILCYVTSTKDEMNILTIFQWLEEYTSLYTCKRRFATMEIMEICSHFCQCHEGGKGDLQVHVWQYWYFYHSPFRHPGIASEKFPISYSNSSGAVCWECVIIHGISCNASSYHCHMLNERS